MAMLAKMEAVRKYGAPTQHVHDGKVVVTNEWIAGTFAGRGFEGDTFEDAAAQLIEYLDQHIGHDSIVGSAVRAVNWTAGENVNLNVQGLLFQPEAT